MTLVVRDFGGEGTFRVTWRPRYVFVEAKGVTVDARHARRVKLLGWLPLLEVRFDVGLHLCVHVYVCGRPSRRPVMV